MHLLEKTNLEVQKYLQYLFKNMIANMAMPCNDQHISCAYNIGTQVYGYLTSISIQYINVQSTLKYAQKEKSISINVVAHTSSSMEPHSEVKAE